MKVLFSPSESKLTGGTVDSSCFGKFIFSELTEKRLWIFTKYKHFLETQDTKALKKLFGIQKQEEIQEYIDSIKAPAYMPAIQRYSGVAFDHLSFNTLPTSAQNYIKKNTIIFSNLFGPILANDNIPNYKIKQGETFCDIKLELFYKDSFSSSLDAFLENETIFDLRAGFYEKFYMPNQKYYTAKFLKNSKVVSHYAKAYRGILLRELALNNINNIDEFQNLNIKNLQIEEIIDIKNKKEFVFSIKD